MVSAFPLFTKCIQFLIKKLSGPSFKFEGQRVQIINTLCVSNDFSHQISDIKQL